MFSETSQNSQENTCARVSFSIKLQPEASNFIKKDTLAQVFSCEFCETSKNTFFAEYLRVTASKVSLRFTQSRTASFRFLYSVLATFLLHFFCRYLSFSNNFLSFSFFLSRYSHYFCAFDLAIFGKLKCQKPVEQSPKSSALYNETYVAIASSIGTLFC